MSTEDNKAVAINFYKEKWLQQQRLSGNANIPHGQSLGADHGYDDCGTILRPLNQ